MNRLGKINDNAYIESFFHSMKADIVLGLRFNEDREIESAVRDYSLLQRHSATLVIELRAASDV